MKRFLIWFSVFLVIFLAIFIYWKYFYDYSEGYRAGLLQKVSYRGTIFKTYEGEMILSSIQSKTDVALASEKFTFSMEDKLFAKQLEQYQGKYIVLHYHEKNGILPWRGDSKYIADSVRLAQ